MKNYIQYEIKTGKIMSRTTCQKGLELFQIDGLDWIEGFNPEATHIQNGTPVKLDCPDDQALMCLRFERNQRLQSCDWTQLPDVPDKTKKEWARYRQELRDFPETCKDLRNPDWPVPPGLE